MGDQDKGRSPKGLKSLIDVPSVAHLKVQVLSINMNLTSSPKRFPSPSYPFGGKLLIEVPNVVHVKVHVLSFNMILISSP